MRSFWIRNPNYDDKAVATLTYDEETREYHIEVPEDVESRELPLIIADLVDMGQRSIGPYWSLRWVQGRVVPPERQNIGEILREHGMEYYDEFPLLVDGRGWCCQDECYLEEI